MNNMINLKYKYRNKEGLIKFALEEKIRDACTKVAMQLDIDIDTIVVILNEEKLNSKSKKTFEDIQNSYKLNKNIIEMLFFDDPDKIIKVIVDYEGNRKEIKAKKEEDSLFQIFGKLKLNIEKMFFVGGGEAIQKEDLKKNIKELNNIENEDGELNFLAYDIDDEDDDGNNNEKIEDKKVDDINNDKANNNNIDKSNEQISNNNNLNEKLLDVNNTNDKILNVNNPNDKILNIEGDKDKKEKKVRNISLEMYKHFLTKTFVTLKVEYFIIMGLTWLGCYYNINEVFIKSKAAMLLTFIPTIFFLYVFSIFTFYLILENDNPEKIKEKFVYFTTCISISFYILSNIFFCFLLTNFMEYKYIIMELFLIIIDYLLLELYHFYVLTNKYFLLPLILANIILIIIYSFIWIEGIRVIVNISIITFVAILYIIIIHHIMEKYEEEEYLFGVYTFNYGVFFPATCIITVMIIIIGLIISTKCCKNKEGKDKNKNKEDKDNDKEKIVVNDKDNDKNN